MLISDLTSLAKLVLVGHREKRGGEGERGSGYTFLGYKKAIPGTELGLRWEVAYK